MSVPPTFTEMVKGCCLVDMKAMSAVLLDHIADAEKIAKDPTLLVDFVPDFIVEEDLLGDIKGEVVNIMDKNRSSSHVTSQWLASDGNSYKFGNRNYKAMDIKCFPNIVQVMKAINAHPSSTGDMDSCLVNRYDNADIAGRLHADNEKTISQSSSICTVSLGPTRTIDFRPDSHTGIVKSLSLTNGSMFIMRPGCQRTFKHKLNKGDYPKAAVRYSLSFRKSVSGPSQDNNRNVLDSSTIPSSQADPRTPVVLIAGDSITGRLNTDKLSKQRVRVDNISVGGYTIHQTQSAIEEYYDEQKDNVCVTKVFISVGCNDIRYVYSRGVSHLKAPLVRLMIKMKSLFPNAQVYFHSVLPNMVVNPWTVKNVYGINSLIRVCCIANKMFYLNFFRSFLTVKGERDDRLFDGPVHPKKSCMGIIARHYIKLIHNCDSTSFNPDVF